LIKKIEIVSEDEEIENEYNSTKSPEVKIKSISKTKNINKTISKSVNKPTKIKKVIIESDSSDSSDSDVSDSDNTSCSNSDSDYDLEDDSNKMSKSNSVKSNSSEILSDDYEEHNIFIKKLTGPMIPVLVAPCEKFVFPIVKDKVEEEEKLTNYFVKHYSKCINCVDCDNNLCSLRSNLNNKNTTYEYYYGKRSDSYMEFELENYNKVKPSEDFEDEATNIVRIIHIKDSSNIYYNNILVSWYKL
jgi:hypothetical protein